MLIIVASFDNHPVWLSTIKNLRKKVVETVRRSERLREREKRTTEQQHSVAVSNQRKLVGANTRTAQR
jgi:hypothetical protein